MLKRELSDAKAEILNLQGQLPKKAPAPAPAPPKEIKLTDEDGNEIEPGTILPTPEEDEKIMNAIKEFDAELKKKKAPKGTKAAAAKESTEPITEAKAPKAEPKAVKTKTVKKKKVVKKKVIKKKVAKSAPVPVAADASASDSNPWASLTKSALSRKTGKEISEYLEERGVATKGEDGKALLKKILIEAVNNL